MTSLDRADLWLDQAVGHHVEGDLDAGEAAALTAKIKAYVGVTWILIHEAHRRRADKALGYKSWADYVKAEFDMSRAYAYRLVAHAEAVYELAGAVGLTEVSPIGDIPEGVTRGQDIESIADEVERQAASLPPDATDEDRAEVVRTTLAKQTHKVTETTVTEFDPNTGEVLSPAGDTDPDQTSGEEGPSTASRSDDEAEVASPSSPVPPKANPALVLMRDLSTLRAEVAKWMAFDRHEQVIASMSTEQRDDYRRFCLSVFNHASATLDHLDAPARLKAVQ